MIDLLRRVSQANRVSYGFALMTALLIVVATLSIQALVALPDSQALQWRIGAITAVGTLIGLVGGYFVRMSIKAPVEDTANAVMRIAGGDLETKIDSSGRDELSWLRYELNTMRKKLRETVIGVRDSVDSVAAASQQIAHGNNDLSSRTEEQASALEETSRSMNRLADTVRHNAQTAMAASTEMTQARDVASDGGDIMRKVVQRMEEIHQSSTKISDIIGVIDSIAFQTNILALNAAVEAARAGEQGRGFAVVASEVRGLAQRCASAAKEVKLLIGDSRDKVDAGTHLVGQAGDTMKILLDRVSRVSRLIAEMASAGLSQSDGIAQVHQAIAQIDGATQQNATLVEEVAAAAQSLTGQSDKLAHAMSAFTVAR